MKTRQPPGQEVHQSMKRLRNGDDASYLERTGSRLRDMNSAYEDVIEGDAEDVRTRIEQMGYGGRRGRDHTDKPAT